MQHPETFPEAYAAALETQDWEEVAPLIHKDACVTFSNGAHFIGKTAVQSAFQRNFTLITEEQYSISDIHWVRKTNTCAVYLFTYQWQGVIDGKPASGSGRGTAVLTRENGIWLLLSEHLGPRPTAE